MSQAAPVRWPRPAGPRATGLDDLLWPRAALQAHEARARAGRPAGSLMTTAGFVAARLALALAPAAQRRLVLCGAGHNGGDGWSLACALHGAGAAVEVMPLQSPQAGEPAAAAARARSLGLPILEAAALPSRLASLEADDLIVDALFGLGLRADRPPPGWFCSARDALRASRSPVLALDLPSGLDADTGLTLDGGALQARWTLSLLGHKPGLWTGEGRDAAGLIWHHDLDILPQAEASPWRLLDGAGLGWPSRCHASHKGRHGTVAVIGGGPGMAGALRLAAGAALRAGAGRVHAVSLADAGAWTGDAACMQARPEAWLGSDDEARDRRQAAVVVAGCGAGRALDPALLSLLEDAPRLLLDADALNAVAASASLQAALRARAGRGLASILTPHPLEAARLLGTEAATVQADRLEAAGRLAASFSAWVVLKGSGSVIVRPDGPGGWLNTSGNGALAGAGTGDVLAGWIGGLWAQGLEAGAACRLGTWSHGAAADRGNPDHSPPEPMTADALLEALGRLPRT